MSGLGVLVSLVEDSALRDKSWIASCALRLRTPSARPCAHSQNPDFSSQNKGHRSALADVSLEILESFAGVFRFCASFLESRLACVCGSPTF